MPDAGPSLEIGDLVRVRRDPEYGPGPWPAEPTGTVTAHPQADDGMGTTRSVATMSGPSWFYWIVFDEPQFGADGGGPYLSAEVVAKYVEPI